jgi:hypothetical protein
MERERERERDLEREGHVPHRRVLSQPEFREREIERETEIFRERGHGRSG